MHKVCLALDDVIFFLVSAHICQSVKRQGQRCTQSWEVSAVEGLLPGSQVNTGMIKMYQAEVLGKFPIMQHMLFGSLLTFPEAAP